jgi:hypothetical protein
MPQDKKFYACGQHCVVVYDVGIRAGGPKNNRNLNVARELEVVARCAPRCRESTQ